MTHFYSAKQIIMTRFTLFFFLLLTFFSASAQMNSDSTVKNSNIKLFTRVKNGATELRWYPADAAAWRKGNNTGYTIKRKTISGSGAGEFAVLAVIKPYEKNDSRFTAGNNFVKLTQKAIYTPVSAKEFTAKQNDENELFFGYILATSLSADAAESAGLIFRDDKIEAGQEYAYTITLNAGKGKKYAEDELLTIVSDTRSAYRAPAVQDVVSEEGEGYVKLIWNNTSNREFFVTYNIERSSDGGKSFIKINKTPFTTAAENATTLYYTDSVRNYIPYQYRISGITPWADAGSPSVVMAAMGRDRTAASPPKNTIAKGDRAKIVITWELPVSSPDLIGFKIARSHLLEGPFHALNDKIVAVSERSFADIKPAPAEPFYAVYAVDTANNVSSTFSVMASIYDTIAPLKPTALQGLIDSNGVVKLNWKFGNDNDLLGYQVYMANGRNNIFRQVTSSPLIDSAITDTVTMRSLTEEVYYKITAVDYNNNASSYSEILTVKRPDIVPPAAPVIIRYNITGNTAEIKWANSKSTDVVKHAVYKTEEGKTEMLIKEFRDSTSLLSDGSLMAGTNYTYVVKAVDDAGLVSASAPLAISTADASVMPGIENLAAKYEPGAKNTKLQWKYDQKGNYEFVVFRGMGADPLQAYKKVSGDKKAFEETAVPGMYNYAVKVIYASGAESALSDAVAVTAK